jgi:GPH family glycoside/pentoside/hexuronide:cation symporter
MAQSLKWSQRIGYGIGDFGFNLYFTTASLFLLLFYTDVAGLSPATAGWVFAAALIWDALIDPVMGYMASRTRSRWGRYRPWLLFGSIPLAASWVLMFLPTGLTGTALTLFALAAHMLFRTCYTICSMPYVSLSAAMTTDSNERGMLASLRMLAATSAGLVIAFFTLKLVTALGGGDQARGFLLTAMLFGGLAAAMMLVTYATSSEDPDAVNAPEPSLADMLRMLKGNRALWLVCGAMLMGAMGSTFFGKAIPYHLKYDVGREDLIGPALGLMVAAAFVSIPLWTLLMQRTSKRLVAVAGAALAVLCYPVFFSLHGASISTLFLPLGVLGLAAGASYLTFWAMLPDTVEYGEWRSGVRAEGIIFGFVIFVQKAALGLAVGLLGETLAGMGYVANQPQTPATLLGIREMMLWAPMLFGVASALFLVFYPLDRRTHGRIAAIVRRRRPGPAA